MSAILPRVFIGSSTEAEIFANALQKALSANGDVKTWRNAPEFKPTHSTLSSLQNAAVNYDFGVFIFGPDDVTVSRGEKMISTRDNVLFEFGLFLGALGSDRVIGITQRAKPRSGRIKKPSDLLGINMPEFPYPIGKYNKNLSDEEAGKLIENSAEIVRESISKYGINLKIDLVSQYGVFDNKIEFGFKLPADRLSRYSEKLRGRRLFAVARKHETGMIAETDPNIAKSRVDAFPRYHIQDMDLIVRLGFRAEPGNLIEGYLLLAPDNDATRGGSLADLFSAGCLEIASRQYLV